MASGDTAEVKADGSPGYPGLPIYDAPCDDEISEECEANDGYMEISLPNMTGYVVKG